MKKYEFELNRYVLDIFFPKERIKNKVQILNILMEATRYIMPIPLNMKVENSNKLILIIDKMSRFVFCTIDKCYSITFPFMVNENDDKLSFSYDGMEVDSQIISGVISIIKSESFDDKCSLDFVDPIYEFENEFNENFWPFLKNLLLFEDGYIRRDRDEKGYLEAKAKGCEHKHPINHLDVFRSSRATFKIGLENEIDNNIFIDILDIKTDCKYLK